MVRKTKEDACITRNRILDAAVELFESQGVSRTSLNGIATHAGVTRGAIYWHFKNKVDLFSAMIERLVCPLLLRSEERTQLMRHDPMGFLRAATMEFFDKLASDPNFYRVFEIFWHKCEYVGDMAIIRHKHLDEGEHHIGIIYEAFAYAQEKGQISTPLTPRQATIGLVSLTDGLIFNWTKNRQLFSLKNDGLPVVDVFLRGLGCRDQRTEDRGQSGAPL
ncbi:MAG: TetR family transcriptional regulator [Zoogloeaceae bacterium]|jgi:TetR/AcrR family acrAB operon transcriptional repressor|nr:TetR family transcriptional regulator [Zoogloeaceae bacterium]